MSAWITVAITFERMLAIAMPLKVALLSTPFRARLLLVVLCIVCLTATACPMWTVGLEYLNNSGPYCQIIDETSYVSW
jgi:hypothetical protein